LTISAIPLIFLNLVWEIECAFYEIEPEWARIEEFLNAIFSGTEREAGNVG
jgi:hypothetical protein